MVSRLGGYSPTAPLLATTQLLPDDRRVSSGRLPIDSDVSASSEPGTSLAVPPPVRRGSKACDQPQKCISEVDPDSILHALDAAVTLGIFIDVHLPAVSQNVTASHGVGGRY